MSAPRSSDQLERSVLNSLLPELEAEGFQVIIQPAQNILPKFLQGYRPDIVAYKADKNLAIEIVGRGPPSKLRATGLHERFAGHPDWELRLVYAPPVVPDADIPAASKQVVSENLDRLEASMDAMGPGAALLTGWAVLEAASRALLPASFGRPQPPARLIEALASEGHVTPDEAELLRRIGRTRNEIAHGRLDLTPSRDDAMALIGVTRSLLQPAA